MIYTLIPVEFITTRNQNNKISLSTKITLNKYNDIRTQDNITKITIEFP